MPKPNSSSPSQDSTGSVTFTRRQLLAGAGAGAAALFLERSGAHGAQAATGGAPQGRAIVFTNTTIVTGDAHQPHMLDAALAIVGDRIAAIGPSDEVAKQYPNAEVIDGRYKALLPGVVNCHAHLSATIARGFNEDYGFPNRSFLKVSAGSFLSPEEDVLMAVIGALDALRSGTTTVVQNTGGIADEAPELVKTGQRWVFAESTNDVEGGGAMSPERFAASKPPVYSAKMREAGLQRIADLHSKWHGAQNGLVSVFPAVGHAENCSPELLQAVRAFAEKHDLGYTIHLNQTVAENQYMMKYHGVRPAIYLQKHGFLGPRLFAAHARYVDDAEIKALGDARTIIAHQAAMASNRGVSPPIPELRRAGCTIAMGTDNNNNDMFAAMKVALLTERIRRGHDDEHPGLLPQPEDILQDAALGGAEAVNQADTIGLLAVGRKADIIVLNTLKPQLQPHGRILSAWFHNGQPSDIESVLVDGRFIVRDGKVLTVDETALVTEAAKVGRRAWDKVREAHPVVPPGRKPTG